MHGGDSIAVRFKAENGRAVTKFGTTSFACGGDGGGELAAVARLVRRAVDAARNPLPGRGQGGLQLDNLRAVEEPDLLAIIGRICMSDALQRFTRTVKIECWLMRSYCRSLPAIVSLPDPLQYSRRSCAAC
jgi:hypothetical protein